MKDYMAALTGIKKAGYYKLPNRKAPSFVL